MIRFLRLSPELLDTWLVNQNLPSINPRYRLRLWQENPAAFDAIRIELIGYFDEALEDARRRPRRGFEDTL